MNVRGVGERSLLKLKPMIGAAKGERTTQQWRVAGPGAGAWVGAPF